MPTISVRDEFRSGGGGGGGLGTKHTTQTWVLCALSIMTFYCLQLLTLIMQCIFQSLMFLCFVLHCLKHKDSFGKSENLSKIFFAEILVFDHDYEGNHRAVMVCSESLLYFLNNLFELFFKLFGGPPNKSIHVINYTLQGVIIIKSLI